MRLAIIGAGASGLVLASRLKDSCDITIYEKNKKIGSKILASGNGRCNLLNLNVGEDSYNNKEFIKKVFEKYDQNKVYEYFTSLGLSLISDSEQRVYPRSLSSLNVLEMLLDNINAKILTETPVKKVKKSGNGYIINDKDYYDYVVIASGSFASVLKDKTVCYDYINNLNIKMTDLYPSLCGFKVKDNIKDLSGLRCRAKVSLYNNDALVYKEEGEVIFKDDGISGIVVMNMSSYYNRYKPGNFVLKLDLLYDIDNISNIKGCIHPLLYKYFVKNHLKIGDLKDFSLHIIDTYSFENAQVCHGGIVLDELKDFEIKKYRHLYAIGEVLDIDGVCGGYNLLFASSSALYLADIIKEEL